MKKNTPVNLDSLSEQDWDEIMDEYINPQYKTGDIIYYCPKHILSVKKMVVVKVYKRTKYELTYYTNDMAGNTYILKYPCKIYDTFIEYLDDLLLSMKMFFNDKLIKKHETKT